MMMHTDISSEETFQKVLRMISLKENMNSILIAKKDRINYYKDQSKIQNLSTICQNIKTLHETEDRGSLENDIPTIN